METNPFLKRLMKVKKEDVLHSSAYGVAQSKHGIGAASSQAFSQRMNIENNRRVVGGYKSSSIANSGINNGPRAKAYVSPSKNEGGITGGFGSSKNNGGTMNRLGPSRNEGGVANRLTSPKNPGISR